MTFAVSLQALDPITPSSSGPNSLAMVAKVIGFVVVVVLASAFLVPRGLELALLRAALGQNDSALRLLEVAYANGDHSTATMVALARHRMRSGNQVGSIELIHAISEHGSEDVQVLEALADLFDLARRPQEVVVVLERLQKLAPEVERQRRLARLYGEQSMERHQAAALSKLVDSFDAGDVADRLLLARLQSQHGEYAQAFATLDRMVKRFPQADDASVVAAKSSALLAVGNSAGAFALARDRLSARPQAASADAPVLAGSFIVGGQPSLVADLLAPLVAGPQPDSRVLAVWAQAMSDSGLTSQALDHIENRPAIAHDTAAQTMRLNLALAAGRLDSTLAVVREMGAQRLSSPVLSSVATLALSKGHKETLAYLKDIAGDAIAQDDPVLAARIALALGDRTTAARLGRAAASQAAQRPDQSLQLARLLQQSGEPSLASEVLRQTAVPFDRLDLLGEYARMHIALGSAVSGLAAIEQALPRPANAATGQYWALLATASGRQSEVLSWLQASGKEPLDEQVLRDIYQLAMDRRAYELAVAAANRVIAQVGPNDRDKLLLAHALLPAGRAADAVAVLRAMPRRGSAVDDLYAAALLAAWRRGEPVIEDLRRLYVDRLARGAQLANREADVLVLVEIGAYAEAVETLETFAAADPERWLSTYLDTAAKAGQRRRTAAMLARLADNSTLRASLRSQLAFALLEVGEKAAAERTFRSLAATTGPHDPATQRLLYLWGPRPTRPQLDWLESRALKATGEERATWMRLLTERGAAGRALEVYRQTEWPPSDGDDVVKACLEALVAGGDRTLLIGTLAELASRTRSGDILARLAQQAAAVGDAMLERQLLEAALSAGNREPALRRALGLSAYRARDFRAAEQHLMAFNEGTGGDPDTYRALGEVRLQRNDSAGAKVSFEQALLGLERRLDTSYSGRLAKAGLLYRLRRPLEAQRLYAELLAERPNDENARADYAAMLIEGGESRLARTVLEARR